MKFAAPLLLLLATPAMAAPAPIVAWAYTVRSGDTLAAIAARMGVATGDLARANGLDPDQRLIAGTTLKRPDPQGMVPERMPAQRRTTPSVRILPAPPALAASATPRLLWPTSGAVVTSFGASVKGRADNGIDLAAFAGMNVRAAAAGRVIFAGTEHERFGQLVIIDHGHGWATAYAYLGKVLVREGSTVAKGTVIARIGTSGEAKKPTLHFELRRDNVPHDPLPALPVRL